MRPEIIQKLEAYFGFGQPEEEADPTSETDPGFMKTRDLMSEFLQAVKLRGRTDFRAKMNAWEAEFQQGADFEEADEESDNEWPVEAGGRPDLDDLDDIPRAVLESLFAPKPDYEAYATAGMRGNGIRIVEPPNNFEWDAPKQTVKLELGQKADTLFFAIENNQGREVAKGARPVSGDLSISIDFEPAGELPGRYYLKVFSKDSFAMIGFYLHKSRLLD